MSDREKYTWAIIKDIQQGILSEGQPLSQRKLGNRYGCGRTLAKAILENLAHSGWIDRMPGGLDGEYVVAGMSNATVEQALELRAMLEIYALEKLLYRIPSVIMNRLRAINSQMFYAGRDGDLKNARSLNDQFHQTLVDAVDTGPLSRHFGYLKASTLNGGHEFFETEEDVFRSACDHASILDALEMRNRDRLRSVSRSHIVGTVANSLIAAE